MRKWYRDTHSNRAYYTDDTMLKSLRLSCRYKLWSNGGARGLPWLRHFVGLKKGL